MTVSHRLPSIVTSDMIYVIQRGKVTTKRSLKRSKDVERIIFIFKVVECGNHVELLEHRGVYHR